MQVDVPEWRGTLEQTMKMSKSRVVVETLNYATLSAFSPSGTVLTPEVVLDAISNDQNGAYHLFAATQKVLDEYENRKALKDILQRDPKLLKFSGLVFDQLLVEIGIAIMDHLPGPHFTFIDPYWALPQEDSDNNSLTEMTAHEIVGHARRLHGMFVAAGIDGQRVIIGIPATQSGVFAAAKLEAEWNISTNLYLISGLIHAIACAEAHPAFITIDVAAVLAWYEQSAQVTCPSPEDWVGGSATNHPGVIAIQSIVRYYKMHMIKTKVVGRNFRTAYEVSLLGIEFDVLSLSPDMMQVLRQVRLPLCVPEFSSANQALVELQDEEFPVPGESTACHLAHAAPTFPAAMLVTQLQTPDGPSVSLNVDWLHSEAFMNPPRLLNSPRPFILLSSITLTSLGRIKVQMNKLHSLVEQSARYRVELRVLPLPELYNRQRAHDFRDNAGERYGYSPPPQKRRNFRSLKSQEGLGNGLPSSCTTPTHSPSPRHPSPRRSSSRGSTLSPTTPPSLADLNGGEAAPGGYASDAEVAKIIAFTCGAHDLGGGKDTKNDRAASEAEIASLSEAFVSPSPDNMNAEVEHNATHVAPEGSTVLQGRSGTTRMAKQSGLTRTPGESQDLALNAMLKERKEVKIMKRANGKAKDSLPMVEGVDFF